MGDPFYLPPFFVFASSHPKPINVYWPRQDEDRGLFRALGQAAIQQGTSRLLHVKLTLWSMSLPMQRFMETGRSTWTSFRPGLCS